MASNVEQEMEFPLLEEQEEVSVEPPLAVGQRKTPWWAMTKTRTFVGLVCVVIIVVLTGAAYFPWPWRRHHKSAKMIYDVDEKGSYRLSVHFPKGYGLARYSVEPNIHDSVPPSSLDNYEFEAWGEKSFSQDSEAKKAIIWISDKPWNDVAFGPVELGDSWEVPLETHYQFRAWHSKPTKTEAIAARCGEWLLLSKTHGREAFRSIMVRRWVGETWNSSDTAAVYGAYNESTKEVNPRVSAPTFYGHVEYFTQEDDPVAPYCRRITVPAHYGLVTFTLWPNDYNGDLSSNFTDGGASVDYAQRHGFATELSSNHPLHLPNETDGDEYLLPPERIVKISSIYHSSDELINPAVARRCGIYAVITKKPQKLYDSIGMWIGKTWIIPNGQFRVVDTDGYEVAVDVPESYGYVWYEVMHAAENETNPYSLAYHYEELHGGGMMWGARIWRSETGDPRTSVLRAEEHVRVLSTSMFSPINNSTNVPKCGTYVVMTNDPLGIYAGLEVAVGNWT